MSIEVTEAGEEWRQAILFIHRKKRYQGVGVVAGYSDDGG